MLDNKSECLCSAVRISTTWLRYFYRLDRWLQKEVIESESKKRKDRRTARRVAFERLGRRVVARSSLGRRVGTRSPDRSRDTGHSRGCLNRFWGVGSFSYQMLIGTYHHRSKYMFTIPDLEYCAISRFSYSLDLTLVHFPLDCSFHSDTKTSDPILTKITP